MALEFQNLWFDQVEDPTFIVPLRREELRRVGSQTPRSNLLQNGYAEWWRDSPEQPGPYYAYQIGTRTWANSRVEQVDSWVEFSAHQKRAQIMDDIESQVPDGSARQLVEDPTLTRRIESGSGGASERKSDLEDEVDANLDSFDATITPTPADGVGFIESRMTIWIDKIEPWAGAPSDDLALYVVLEIMGEGNPAAGIDARAQMYDHLGVDQGVLPFTQNPTSPNIWETNSQVGRYWSDPAQAAGMRLFWNSGSLPVAETRYVQGVGDRASAVVRAPV